MVRANENADPGKDGKSGSLFAKDVFGMAFQYYANDYSSAAATFTNTSLPTGFSNQYSQNIQAMKWQVRGNGMGTGNADMLMYGFKYDEKNQLTEARFGTVAGTSQSTFNTSADAQSGKFNVYNLVYDLNGNMTSMKTNGSGGTVYDDFTYEISGLSGTPENSTPVNNRLAGVKAGASYHRTYSYDAIGQMVSEVRPGNKTNTVVYDSYGNVTSSTIASVIGANFYYNDRGQRLKKESKNSSGVVSNTTWYIRDVAGNVLAIYDDNNAEHTLKQTEIPVYGASRLGIYYKTSVSYIYELKDHLGNIRASVARAKVSGAADIRSWSDYHPFGTVLQGRETLLTQGKRYDYQAGYSEKDGETGWNSFELRMYDSRIARWMSPDPYGVNWSPYMAMGNNPVNMVDPDGGAEGPTGSISGSNGPSNISGSSGSGVPISYQDAWNNTKGFTEGRSYYSGQGSSAFDLYEEPFAPYREGKGFFSRVFGNSSYNQSSFNVTMGYMAGSVGSGYGILNNVNDLESSNFEVGTTASSPPNRKHPLPSWSDMDSNYPKDASGGDMPAPDVYKMVGGKVYKKYTDDPGEYSNACALRVSYALNKSGVNIPETEKTTKGADGKNYFVSAIELNKWMLIYFGGPDLHPRSNFQTNITGNKGIYIVIPNYPGKFGASGHATLFNGSNCIGNHCYFNASGGVYQVNLWILK